MLRYADYPGFPVFRAILICKFKPRRLLLNIHNHRHVAGNCLVARVKWRALSNCLFQQEKSFNCTLS